MLHYLSITGILFQCHIYLPNTAPMIDITEILKTKKFVQIIIEINKVPFTKINAVL